MRMILNPENIYMHKYEMLNIHSDLVSIFLEAVS